MPSELTRRVSRDLRRAAPFLVRMPFWTALSRVLAVSGTSFPAASASLPAIAFCSYFTCVLVRVMFRRFASVRFLVCRMRFSAE